MSTFYSNTSYLNAMVGQTGVTNFNDTTVRTGNWFAIQIIADVIFTTITEVSAEGTADMASGITYPAGIILYGHFTAITLASGTAKAYKIPS